MFVEIAADHFAVFGPVCKRDAGAVNSDESLPVVMDETHEVGFFLIVHLERASGIEEHRVEIVQVFGVVFQLLLGQSFGVGANGGVPKPRFAAQTLDGGQGMRNRFVPVAFFFSNSEQPFLSGSRMRAVG